MTKRIVIALALAASLFAAEGEKAPRKKGSAARSAPTAKTEALTGCVDQRGETYVLAGPAMKEEATLSGKAFSSDNFARYIGHTITVHGTVNRSATPVMVDVVKIDDVSQTCKD